MTANEETKRRQVEKMLRREFAARLAHDTEFLRRVLGRTRGQERGDLHAWLLTLKTAALNALIERALRREFEALLEHEIDMRTAPRPSAEQQAENDFASCMGLLTAYGDDDEAAERKARTP